MPTPKSQQDVGTVNYLQTFAPDLSEVTAPIRDLLKQQNLFLWDEQLHGRSFEQVKKVISEAPVLKYFDTMGETEM